MGSDAALYITQYYREASVLIEEVAKLSPIERFLYWIRERHQIYLKKKAGLPKPWTDDKVLQDWFFTSPYRENDKTTVWFRENVRGKLRDDPDVLMATVIFRWFNLISTGETLLANDLFVNWDLERALEILGEVRANGGQLFTGAYMMNSPGGIGKLEAISQRIENVWKERDSVANEIFHSQTLEGAHEVLTQFEGLGGFMAYEIVCDLRYTYLLENATDKMTWCNPGPGCIRGLYRLNEWEIENKKAGHGYAPPRPDDWLEQMQDLLKITQKRLYKMPPFEMREIEHSLCETDKYTRALLKDGHMKRRYRG